MPVAAASASAICSSSSLRLASVSSLSCAVLRLLSIPAAMNRRIRPVKLVVFFLNRSCHDWLECLSAIGYLAALSVYLISHSHNLHLITITAELEHVPHNESIWTMRKHTRSW